MLSYYFQENRTSRRPFLLLRISFPGRPIFIQFIPDCLTDLGELLVSGPYGDAPLRVDGQVVGLLATRATPGDAP